MTLFEKKLVTLDPMIGRYSNRDGNPVPIFDTKKSIKKFSLYSKKFNFAYVLDTKSIHRVILDGEFVNTDLIHNLKRGEEVVRKVEDIETTKMTFIDTIGAYTSLAKTLVKRKRNNYIRE